ncbi:GroES-like protein [Penicillium lagena]|uniref:GroES-like protein n=1 Tax=Penicillium lagena TaxID=94218 RepID=UPI0025411F16|nr:GroES-like protein [Penicillium lagena]KAJ5620094.1 GroES-like protein [Penicillium lagena]
MPNQIALLVTEIGKPLIKASRPIPEPNDGEVLIRVKVAGLNPHDANCRDEGLFIKDILPAVLAADVAGIVTHLGPNVTRFRIGDHIFGQTSLPNFNTAGLQEFAILDTRFSAGVPLGFTDAQLASLPTNLVTAAVALFDSSCLGIPAPWDSSAASFDYNSTSLLIVGGGSNTGKFGIQLAALAGIANIIVVAGLNGAADLKALGATHIIDRTKSSAEIVTEVREVTGDQLVYAFDTINPPESQFLGVEALSNSKTGKLARSLTMGPIDENKLSFKKSAGFETCDVLGVSNVKMDTSVPLWERVAGLVKEGKIKPLGFHIVKGLDEDLVNKTLDGYTNKTLSGQWQVHL